jgi:hypothetical protein
VRELLILIPTPPRYLSTFTFANTKRAVVLSSAPAFDLQLTNVALDPTPTLPTRHMSGKRSHAEMSGTGREPSALAEAEHAEELLEEYGT